MEGLFKLVILMIFMVLWFSIHKVVQQKLNTSNRVWKWYKPQNKVFVIIDYSLLIVYIAIPFVYSDANLWLLMPFAFAMFSLTASIEQFLYKKADRSYIHSFLDSFFWTTLGIISYFLFR